MCTKHLNHCHFCKESRVMINIHLIFRYTEACLDKEMSTREILRDKIGVCREYVKIFSEMCDIAGFRVKCIRGYTKGPDFVPGKLY